MNKTIEKVICTFFVILLSLPAVFFGVDYEQIANKENRSVSKRPKTKWILKKPDKFFNSVDEYIKDRFGFRTKLITLSGAIRYSVFKSTQSYQKGNLRVLPGKNDWLFLSANNVRARNQWQDIVDIQIGRERFPIQSGQDWARHMLDRKQYLESKGIRFVVLFVPNKHTIYSENLPDWLAVLQKNSIIADASSYLKALGVECIDLRQALMDNKNKILYYKTDTHWNDYGAYIGTLGLLKHLKLKTDHADLFDFEYVNDWKDGPLATDKQLASTLMMYDKFRDVNITPVFKKTIKFEVTNHTNKSKFTTLDPRMTSWDTIEYTNKDAINNESILIIHDSFVMAMSMYINSLVKKVSYVTWARDDAIYLGDTIDKINPSIVVYEILEKFINVPLYGLASKDDNIN